MKYTKIVTLWAVALLVLASLPSCTVGFGPPGHSCHGGGYSGGYYPDRGGHHYSHGGGGGRYLVCPRCHTRHYGPVSSCNRCGLPCGNGGSYYPDRDGRHYDPGAAYLSGGRRYDERSFYPGQSGHDPSSPWGRGPDHNGTQRWGVQWGRNFRPGGEFRKF